jgi:hypothetical protein
LFLILTLIVSLSSELRLLFHTSHLYIYALAVNVARESGWHFSVRGSRR